MEPRGNARGSVLAVGERQKKLPIPGATIRMAHGSARQTLDGRLRFFGVKVIQFIHLQKWLGRPQDRRGLNPESRIGGSGSPRRRRHQRRERSAVPPRRGVFPVSSG